VGGNSKLLVLLDATMFLHHTLQQGSTILKQNADLISLQTMYVFFHKEETVYCLNTVPKLKDPR
jgi:hypothetical protein